MFELFYIKFGHSRKNGQNPQTFQFLVEGTSYLNSKETSGTCLVSPVALHPRIRRWTFSLCRLVPSILDFLCEAPEVLLSRSTPPDAQLFGWDDVGPDIIPVNSHPRRHHPLNQLLGPRLRTPSDPLEPEPPPPRHNKQVIGAPAPQQRAGWLCVYFVQRTRRSPTDPSPGNRGHATPRPVYRRLRHGAPSVPGLRHAASSVPATAPRRAQCTRTAPRRVQCTGDCATARPVYQDYATPRPLY